MQENEFPYLPARGRIYKLAVEDTAVDMLDDYKEEIAAILSTPLDPAWYPDDERHLDRQIRDALSELLEQYLESAFISDKYILPNNETIRSGFISDVVVAVREFREWQYREVQEEEEGQKEEAP
jgi:hypothetical protein